VAIAKKDFTNIELIFPHELFLKGEELFEAKSVIDINKLDSGLFAFTIREGVNIEVEWFKPLTKMQRASCECDFFKIGKMCRHTIAALLAYKAEFYKEKVVVDPLEEIKSKKFNSLNINSILNNLSKEDLKSFVKAYAMTDKKFSIAFKVNFARRVDLEDNEKKYKSILDSIIRPVTTDKNPYKASDIRALINISYEFYGQLDDSMALEEYGEAFLLIKTSLSKMAYAYKHANHYGQEMAKLIIQYLDKLRELLATTKNVGLTEEIIAYLNELSEVSYTPLITGRDNVFDILLSRKVVSLDLEELIKVQLSRNKEDDQSVSILLALLVRYQLIKGGLYVLDKRYFTFADKVGDVLLRSKLYQELVDYFVKYDIKSKEISLYYLQALVNLNSKKVVTESINLFIENRDLRIIDFIKSRLDEVALENFILGLNKKKVKLDTNKQFYMNYLVKINDVATLLQFIKEENNMSFLILHGQLIYKQLPDEATTAYESILESYLNTHIGENTHKFIAEVFAHLNKIGASKVINKLGLMIDLKFSHRAKLEGIIK
jgi:hypothetical protein